MIVNLRNLALGLALVAAPGLAVAQTTAGSSTTGQTSMTRTPATMGMKAPAASSSAASSPAATSMSGGVTHYASQSEASSACAGDTVVWASPRSKALHTSDSRYFGKSKHGFYTCEKSAMSGGYHLAGTGKKHKTS